MTKPMKRVWNEEKDNLLRRHYPKRDLDWVAGRIGVSRGAVKARAQVLGIQRKVHQRVPWTDRQLAYLRKHYAVMLCHNCHKEVHCYPWKNIEMIKAKAEELGIDLKERYDYDTGARE